MVCVIYKLINSVNGKIYIGQTWQSLKDRWDSGYGYVSSPHLYNAILKYGANKFYYEELDTALTQEDADKLEKFYIELHDSRNRKIGYNIKEGGSTGKLSEETKKKLSDSKRGTQVGKDNPFYGHKHSEASKQQMSMNLKGRVPWNKGIPRDAKTKQKISKAQEGKYNREQNPFYGKTHSEEQRAKWSETRRELTDETVRYIRKQLQAGRTITSIAKELNISATSISRIKSGKRYNDVQ